MRFFQNLLVGLRAYIKAFRFILDHKLYWYVLIPAILMLGIYQLGFMIELNKPEAKAENMNQIIWYLIHFDSSDAICKVFGGHIAFSAPLSFISKS